MINIKDNSLKNEKHYDSIYKNVNIDAILNIINNIENFLADAIKTDTSWVGLYYGDFKDRLKGKKILELGCGDCTNLAVMAVLGAEVVGNDISQESGVIIEKLNANYDFDYPIKFISGDFLDSKIEENQFDFVIGKAFIHHLTNEQEYQFTELIVKSLKSTGVVRYFEPAVNSKFLDNLRWHTPVKGRPSKFQRKKFEIWKKNDPHPERDNSSKHYIYIGNKFFNEVKIVPIGTIERFCKLLPSKWNRPFRRISYKIEKLLPNSLNLHLTRSQLIEYKYPKK
jgi:2-polyprenyl-3-methyl-5-hydroxy-6-metoxy-1,4-benzoquinol methylase